MEHCSTWNARVHLRSDWYAWFWEKRCVIERAHAGFWEPFLERWVESDQQKLRNCLCSQSHGDVNRRKHYELGVPWCTCRALGRWCYRELRKYQARQVRSPHLGSILCGLITRERAVAQGGAGGCYVSGRIERGWGREKWERCWGAREELEGQEWIGMRMLAGRGMWTWRVSAKTWHTLEG